MLQAYLQSFLIYGTKVSLVGLYFSISSSLLVFLLNWLGLINLTPVWVFLAVSCYVFIFFSVLYHSNTTETEDSLRRGII